jgi:hypothetical protein
MAWTAKISGEENLAPEMRAAYEAGVQAGLEALGVKGAEMVVENIVTPYNGLPPAVCFGNLAASVVSEFVREASMVTEIVGVSPNVGADVYAAPVETGARPHFPPASALVPWVQKKFGIDDEKQALGVAFAISKKMSQRGTQGHFMFARALDALEPLAVPVLDHNIAMAFAAHGFTGATA